MNSESLWLTILGAFIGLAGSLFITHLYYKRSKPVQGMLESIVKQLRLAFIHETFPGFFKSLDANFLLNEGFDKSKPEDIPQLDRVIFDQALIYPGSRVNVLLKLVDLGYNLAIPEGVHARGPNGETLMVRALGLGYALTSFEISPSAKLSPYTLSITLTDNAENSTERTLTFRVVDKPKTA